MIIIWQGITIHFTYKSKLLWYLYIRLCANVIINRWYYSCLASKS